MSSLKYLKLSLPSKSSLLCCEINAREPPPNHNRNHLLPFSFTLYFILSYLSPSHILPPDETQSQQRTRAFYLLPSLSSPFSFIFFSSTVDSSKVSHGNPELHHAYLSDLLSSQPRDPTRFLSVDLHLPLPCLGSPLCGFLRAAG